MPAKKPTADEKLTARCNMAAFRLGALHAKDLIDDKTADRLHSAINALDAVQCAQSQLHYGSGNEALEKRLNNPIRQLRQAFVRKVDAVCRKVDKTQLTPAQRAKLQL